MTHKALHTHIICDERSFGDSGVIIRWELDTLRCVKFDFDFAVTATADRT
jgi:hypothetical protein